MLVKIAVTGGIATGKSLVCQIMREQGLYLVSADEISHQLLAPNQESIVTQLGDGIVTDGTLDRGKIAHLVFNQPEALKRLEAILHPQIVRKIEDQYQEVAHLASYKAFVVEFPLLFEIGFDQWFDFSIAVVAPENAIDMRLKQKGMKGEDYRKRQSRFLPQDVIAKRADFTLVNDGTIEELKTKIHHILKKVYETNGSRRASDKA